MDIWRNWWTIDGRSTKNRWTLDGTLEREPSAASREEPAATTTTTSEEAVHQEAPADPPATSPPQAGWGSPVWLISRGFLKSLGILKSPWVSSLKWSSLDDLGVPSHFRKSPNLYCLQLILQPRAFKQSWPVWGYKSHNDGPNLRTNQTLMMMHSKELKVKWCIGQ